MNPREDGILPNFFVEKRVGSVDNFIHETVWKTQIGEMDKSCQALF